MSALTFSSALLNSPMVKAAGRSIDRDTADLVQGYLDGTVRTKATSRPPQNGLARTGKWFREKFGRKWQRSPDRVASMKRRRILAGSSGLPDTIRHHYTEGERAALVVVAGEVKRQGICDLAIDAIAALAGISRTTVQNALRKAASLRHVRVDARPRVGQKNLTNLVRVACDDWLSWLRKAPSPLRSIGFKKLHPTKNTIKTSRKNDAQATEHQPAEVSQGAYDGVGRQPRGPTESAGR